MQHKLITADDEEPQVIAPAHARTGASRHSAASPAAAFACRGAKSFDRDFVARTSNEILHRLLNDPHPDLGPNCDFDSVSNLDSLDGKSRFWLSLDLDSDPTIVPDTVSIRFVPIPFKLSERPCFLTPKTHIVQRQTRAPTAPAVSNTCRGHATRHLRSHVGVGSRKQNIKSSKA
ncbi:hypothetical protein EVAR_100202_1 [Eumeta japonica]|uniref:Uncharacterized protein n=1 Tax=Eumeta variegata TaxID=151549 RepID=A0A4C1TEU5_EUMVA|nr:hypothetical protein EVAR_100202_1 [Eumeta japonica]